MSDLRIPDLNTVIIAGRLARDPELKYTSANRPYCKVTVANSRKYKTKEGEQKEESVFIDGTLWDKAAEYVGKLAKGRPVLVEGRLRQEEWEDRESGQKRSKICMQVNRLTPLDWDTQGGSSAAPATSSDDDIPF